MVPQPVLVPPGAVIVERTKKTSTRSSLDKSTQTRTNRHLMLDIFVRLASGSIISVYPFVQLCLRHLNLSVESHWIRKAKSRGMFVQTLTCRKLAKPSRNCKLTFKIEIAFNASRYCRNQGCLEPWPWNPKRRKTAHILIQPNRISHLYSV